MTNDSTPATADKLAEAVEYRIETKPIHYNGHQWAALDQSTYAKFLGVTVRTVQRWIAKPPFVTMCKVVDGRKLCLVRIGEPDPLPPPDDPTILAKAMSSLWTRELRALRRRQIADLRETGDHAVADKLEASQPRRTSSREYGMMIGLAKEWPAEHAVAILAYVLREWSVFMTGVKLAIDALPPEERIVRFYAFPTITVIRRFHSVAIEAWLMHMQEHHAGTLGVGTYNLFANAAE